MQSTDEIEKKINELSGKLQIVTASLEKKSNELSSLKRSHTELISRNAGSLHQPKSIKIARISIEQAELDLADLVIAKEHLEEALQQQQEQLALASLCQQAGVCNEKKTIFFEIFNRAWNVGGVELKKLLQEWEAVVLELKQAENPILILLPILAELQKRGLSYEAFLERGSIEPADPDIDNSYLDGLRSQYREPLNAIRDLELPQINTIGSNLINVLSWVDGSELKDFIFKDAQPQKEFHTVGTNPNTTVSINPLHRDPSYWARVEREKKIPKQPQS